MKNKKMAGVFQTEQEAIKAVQELKSQGYRSDQISIVAKDKDDLSAMTEETGSKAPEGIATGAAAGGLLGGISGIVLGMGALAIPGIGPIIAAGPIVAGLSGAAIGAGTGGLVGGLIGMGISEEEAIVYNTHVRKGNILVLVDSDNEFDEEAYETFRANNSMISNSYHRNYDDYDRIEENYDRMR